MCHAREPGQLRTGWREPVKMVREELLSRQAAWESRTIRSRCCASNPYEERGNVKAAAHAGDNGEVIDLKRLLQP